MTNREELVVSSGSFYWMACLQQRSVFIFYVYLAQNGAVPMTVAQLHRPSLNGWSDGQSLSWESLEAPPEFFHYLEALFWCMFGFRAQCRPCDLKKRSYFAYGPVASALVIIPFLHSWEFEMPQGLCSYSWPILWDQHLVGYRKYLSYHPVSPFHGWREEEWGGELGSRSLIHTASSWEGLKLWFSAGAAH